MTLASLLKALAQRRERTRFNDVMREHGAALGRLAAGYAPAGARREDLEQEISFAVWQALPRFRDQSSLRTYVFRVAHNRCIDLIRRGRGTLGDFCGDLDSFELDQPSPERLAVSRSELEQVADGLRTLPVGQRQAIMLVLEGFTHGEISKMTGVTESAISVRIHRARHALAAQLNRSDT